jgi:hypothetical protein
MNQTKWFVTKIRVQSKNHMNNFGYHILFLKLLKKVSYSNDFL